jgi:hypothetical protein
MISFFLAAFVALIIGLLGMAGVVFWKAYSLKLLEKAPLPFLRQSKKGSPKTFFGLDSEKVLRRLLLRTKILFLRGENKIDSWMRRVASSKKFSEDYWREIKKKK